MAAQVRTPPSISLARTLPSISLAMLAADEVSKKSKKKRRKERVAGEAEEPVADEEGRRRKKKKKNAAAGRIIEADEVEPAADAAEAQSKKKKKKKRKEEEEREKKRDERRNNECSSSAQGHLEKEDGAGPHKDKKTKNKVKRRKGTEVRSKEDANKDGRVKETSANKKRNEHTDGSECSHSKKRKERVAEKAEEPVVEEGRRGKRKKKKDAAERISENGCGKEADEVELAIDTDDAQRVEEIKEKMKKGKKRKEEEEREKKREERQNNECNYSVQELLEKEDRAGPHEEKKKKNNKDKKRNGASSEAEEMRSKKHVNKDGRAKETSKKKKKKKEPTDRSECSQSKKTSKARRVSFSGNVEVFPLNGDDYSREEEYTEENLVRGKRFSKEEDQLIMDSVNHYIQTNQLGEDGLKMVLKCSKYPQVKNCWKEIGRALPWRPYLAVYNRAHTLFERSDERGFSAEEKDIIMKFYAEHGPKWKELADLLKKRRVHVKDAWRRMRLPNKKWGKWSQDEYQHLFDLVNLDLRIKAFEKKKSAEVMKRENISWEAISDKLTTRRMSCCCHKWYDQLRSPLVAQHVWADTDDYRLLEALQKQDGCNVDEVDWDGLVDGRSSEVCRRRWDEMVRHIGGYRERTFIEQVGVLSKRYCRDMLEYRFKRDQAEEEEED